MRSPGPSERLLGEGADERQPVTSMGGFMRTGRLVLAGLLAGCAAGPDMSALSSGDAASGERIYKQEDCASCHGETGDGGSGGSLGSIHGMEDLELWEFIYYGTDGMPDYPHLSEQEIADMIAWMREAVL